LPEKGIIHHLRRTNIGRAQNNILLWRASKVPPPCGNFTGALIRNFRRATLYPSPGGWCGRGARQPGQVRKEAAVTNPPRVVPASHLPPKHRDKCRARAGSACYSPKAPLSTER